MIEQRKYMRFNLFLDASSRAGSKMKKLKVNDFSREGIGVSSGDFLAEGEDIEMELMIPGDNVPVLFTGEIVWTGGSAPDGTQCRSGVKFKRISNNARNRILEYVYQKWIMPAKAEVK